MTHLPDSHESSDADASSADLDAEQLFGSLTATDSPDAGGAPVASPEPPIDVIPLDGSRASDGKWSLTVPPTSAAERARRHLQDLRNGGLVQLPDDLIERLILSAVDPVVLEGSTPNKLRTEHGWLLTLEARLFTPLVNVAIANDRWVADAVYDADPSAGDNGRLHAVPMPASHTTHAALLYDAPTEVLLSAADDNFQRVLRDNPQDVGRRLIEQPVTLVATYIGASGAGAESSELASVDGNCRVSSGLDRLKIVVDWLPGRIKDSSPPYKEMPRAQQLSLTPSLLANLTVTERRSVVRRLAKAAGDRLAQPTKAPSARGHASDQRDRNKAATTLNVLTVPARIIVGFLDDDPDRYGMTRFASAVRALLVQMNVEGKPLDDSARHAISAEEIVLALAADGVVDDSTREILIGRTAVTEAMRTRGLDPALPDLRAALVLQVLCGNGDKLRAVLREKLDKTQIHPSDRSRPAVELAIRSYTASLPADELKQTRTALETNAIWPDLANKPWEVVNIDSDEAVDLLAMYAREQRESGGPLLRLLGVLGMFALVSTGNLLAPRGSAEQLVEDMPIDRGTVATIVGKILRHDWGITLLTDAIKRARAGQRQLRWVDNKGQLIDAPADWRGAHFDANLRLAAKRESVHAAVIPGSTQERFAWTAVCEAVDTAKEKLIHYKDLRAENGTVDKLPWLEVEPTMTTLQKLSANVQALSEPQSLELT